MKIYLIRHGLTEGNRRRAYIGAGIDEPLCAEGIDALREKRYPRADVVFSSPMKRCVMTAELIYPRQDVTVCEGLTEMRFGDFEGKTYGELKDNPAYVKWLESGGERAFPNGEAKGEFALRVRSAFRECVRSVCPVKAESAAFVVHGGTIMAIMEEYGTPKGEYYKWQVKNGEWLSFSLSEINMGA